MIPSFTDITIWPYEVQFKTRSIRVNAASERAATTKAVSMLNPRERRTVLSVESVVATSEQMHRILA
jgi:hypothetical protein